MLDLKRLEFEYSSNVISREFTVQNGATGWTEDLLLISLESALVHQELRWNEVLLEKRTMRQSFKRELAELRYGHDNAVVHELV